MCRSAESIGVLLNAHADAARFTRQVNHPACKIMYDTFHSNTKRERIWATLHEINDVVQHIHISENDRSTRSRQRQSRKEFHWSGGDQIRWLAGDRSVWSSATKLAAATKIWRRMFESELKLREEGLAFMKAQVAKKFA